MSSKYKTMTPLSLLTCAILASFSTATIAEETLSQTLNKVSNNQNITIYAKPSIITGLAKDVDQTGTAKNTISQLIAGSDLQAVWLDTDTVVIKRKTNTESAASLAIASNNVNTVERISVYGLHNQLILDSGTATKSNMTLMQTPAAVVVVDKRILSEQSSETLQDSIRNISGVTQAGNNYGIGDNLIIRGLEANYTYDGIYGGADLGNNYNPTRSMTNVESVEVLKGPATGLYGMGAAGGVINLIEKKPQQKEQYEIKALIGQWNNTAVMLDATAGLTDKAAYRVVANYEKSDGYRDLSTERAELYASLSYDFSDDNAILFSAAYIDDSIQIDSVGDPVRILSVDDINVDPSELTGDDLVNDTDADGDGISGVQLTQAQRDELASTVLASDGLQPYSLGSGGLISPLSEPNEGKELRFKLRQDLNISDNLKLTQQIQYRDYSSEFTRQTGGLNFIYWNRNGEINADPRAPLVIDDVLYPYAARRQEYRHQTAEETTWQYFVDLTSTWSSGNFSGEHLISANYESRDASVQSSSIYDADGGGSLPYILDIRSPNWPTGDFDDYDPILKTNYDKSVTAWGVSAQEVIYFDDSFTGRFGLAYTGISQDYQHKGTVSTPDIGKELDTDDNGLTYNLGLNYKFTEQFATFVNYSKGTTAYSLLGSLEADGDDRPNSESISIDLGFRMTAFDENLLMSFVLFETSRTNLRYSNEEYNDNVDDAEYNISVAQYFYDEEDRSRGAELDLNLALNDQWSMNFNATYMDATTVQGDISEGQSKGVPLKYARVWTSYEHTFAALPAPIKFSLGLSYEDERSLYASAYGVPYAYINSYQLWDAAVSYGVDNWNVQLNVDNLADKTYYSKAMYAGGLPGESRNAKLTVTYKF
ncbi:TonB-dependent receptor [Pseudoalteromonas sp. MMG010]|uniref:TonB-dependent receptor n=1 Tax=Pseudoalteromonas sp. MMG010 TaxID=2822685 RepID=UPI001FFCA982|nr:TonB-dependent receptor [Pseudoalteromonas sp. MMG010]